ncbi:MAG TPA: hypothetical protein PKX85_05620 [Candidatus Hydrogenedentes bacterium]|nr:hypothetical protein [Candidatus Hydrogenedentota bacterium]
MRPVRNAAGRVFVLAGWLLLAGATARAAELSIPSSMPQRLSVIDDVLYFSADDGVHGRELWAVDRQHHPRMVADIEPGPGSSSPEQFHAGQGNVIFTATTSASGTEPWLLNPAGGPPRQLADLAPGPKSSPAALVSPSPGRLLAFVGTNGTACTLWRVNLDSLTLELVKRAGTWTENAYAALNSGALLFSSQNQLWISNGTAEGTVVLLEQTINIGEIASLGERAILSMVHPECGFELFVCDGTPNSIALLRDIMPGLEGSNPRNFFSTGERVFFEADDGDHGLELWVTDGSLEGTYLVKDILPGKGSSDPHYFAQCGDAVYFAATDGASGIELWRSNGTGAGTWRVSELAPVSGSGAVWSIMSFKDKVFFCSDSQAFGEEVFYTAGAPGGATVLMDVVPGPGSSGPDNLTVFGDDLFFTCNDGKHGEELWMSAGQAGRPVLVADIYAPPAEKALSSSPRHLTPFQGGLLFCARDIGHGAELWRTDGTSDGTVLVNDIVAGPADSGPSAFAVLGDRAFFSAAEPSTGRELWVTDGTAEHTRPVADLWPGPASSNPRQLVAVAGAICFLASDDAGTRVWRSDGTPEGTVPLPVAAPGDDLLFNRVFAWRDAVYAYASTASDSVSLFSASPGGAQLEQLVTLPGQGPGAMRGGGGGAAPETVREPAATVCALFPPGRELPFTQPARMGDVTYFAAYTPECGTELWKTGAALRDATLVADIFRGPASSCPTHLTPVGQRLYFIAETLQQGRVLYESDGTAGGTAMLRPLEPRGFAYPVMTPVELAAFGTGKVFLIAPHPTRGVPGQLELCLLTLSDAGPILNMFPTAEAVKTCFHALTESGHLMYFILDDGLHGEELWVSDGAPEGTRIVKDILE